MIALIDYGMGNIRSVQNALEYLNVPYTLTSDPAVVQSSDRIILPGVGSFREAMHNLDAAGLSDAIRTAVAGGTPILGICLGMQLLADEGEEDGPTRGLGLVRGTVRRFPRTDLRVPHVGFNEVHARADSTLFAGVPDADFYFVHSYHLECADPHDVAGATNYGGTFVAAVEHGHVFGTQFHPEKSQSNGLRVLRNFCEVAAC